MSKAGDNLLKIAQVLKSNGADGELVLSFREIAPDDINIKEPVFIFYDGLPVPFFIESFSIKGNKRALVRLTDILSNDDAEEIAGKAVYADKSAISQYDEDFHNLEGWTLKNADSFQVGTIISIEEIPGNPCLCVDTKNGQVLIPLHEDLILSVNEDLQEIVMSIPEGLV